MHQPVTREELLDIAQYEKARPEFRERVLAQKELRRIPVGAHFTFLFENRLTVLYQIQEMMRVERIVDEQAILHEMNTYNELVPSEGNLAATLLIEYQTPEERQEHLPQLLGVEEHVYLRIGDLAPARGEFDRRQIGESRVSSVQYMRFPLNAAHREAWLAAARAGSLLLGIDHPHYTHETVISSATAEALAADFS